MKNKVIALLIGLIIAQNALGEAPGVQAMGQPKPPSCEALTEPLERKLAACDKLVKAQDLSIKNLKTMNKTYEDKIVDLTAPPIVPEWVWVLGLIGLGYAAGRSF